MPLQQHHIDQLKALYRSEHGVELDDKEAWAMAIRLIDLFRVLSEEQPTPTAEVRTISPLSHSRSFGTVVEPQ